MHLSKRVRARFLLIFIAMLPLVSVFAADAPAPVASPTATPAFVPPPPPVTPVFNCKPLPKFDPADWSAVEKAFSDAVAIPYRQAWLEKPDEKFEAATVRIGWTRDAVWFYCVMEDRYIFNPTTRMNEIPDPAIAAGNEVSTVMGDAFEVLVRHEDINPGPYYELHVTPENQVLQLTWGSWRDYLETGRHIEMHFIDGEKAFTSFTKIDNMHKQWRVLMKVPVALLKMDAIIPGDSWRFSCCRYDFDQGNPRAVYSSTSPIQSYRGHRMSFQRQEEWGILKFVK
ncbi:MAG: hypothetical protein ABI443_00835 [Chthoniobacterales bacterium]